MANTIKWYDRQSSWVLMASLAIGAQSQINGLYHDGQHYWICENTSDTIECWALEGGTFYQVRSFGLPATYTNPLGITGDGQDLYVTCTRTDTGPPVASYCALIKLDKAGNLLRRFNALEAGATVESLMDLTFDGQNIAVLRLISSGPSTEHTTIIDPTSGLEVYRSPDWGRLPRCLEFDGMQYVAVVDITTTFRAATVTVDGGLLSLLTSFGTNQAYGLTMVRGQMDMQGQLEDYSGQLVAVAFRA